MSKISFIVVCLLLTFIHLDLNAQALTDGPYIFYKAGKIYSKSVMITKGTPHFVLDSFPENSKKNHSIRVHLDQHPEWDFNLKLKVDNLPSQTVSPGSSKMVFLSDIEGEFEPFRKLLLAAKVIDKKYNWTFGKGKLIIAGDLFDRGKQVCQFLWLLYLLEDEAKAAGGNVHVILGNHDIMNLSGDYRYVDRSYFLNASLMNVNYEDLYSKDTELGRWLRSKNIMEKVGDLLVLHGGVSHTLNKMALPLDLINIRCRPFFDQADKETNITDKPLLPFFDPGGTSPFWYRGYFVEPKASMAQIDSTLSLYGCKKIIVGHDIIDHVSAFYEGKVIGVDVNEHEGHHEALLLEKEKFYRIDEKGIKTLITNQ